METLAPLSNVTALKSSLTLSDSTPLPKDQQLCHIISSKGKTTLLVSPEAILVGNKNSLKYSSLPLASVDVILTVKPLGKSKTLQDAAGIIN